MIVPAGIHIHEYQLHHITFLIYLTSIISIYLPNKGYVNQQGGGDVPAELNYIFDLFNLHY